LIAIRTKGLIRDYGDLRAVDGVNLQIPEGEFYCLMGPNGSGKTTLVSILASVLLPTQGDVEIFGKPPQESRHLVGYVPQANFTSPKLSGRENLEYLARLLGYGSRESRQIVEDLLAKVELEQYADKRVSTYSGGMRKRLEVASALFPDLKVMLLDEPTTGLDPSARRKFFGLILDIKSEDTTIVLITHLGSDAELASTVGLIDRGKIVAEGTPEALKDSSGLNNVINIETAAKSQKAMEALGRFSSGGEVLETDTGYRIYSDDSDRSTPEIVRALDATGAKVLEIGSSQPTLEDVFFSLTGRSVTEE
jgi:ABC-2 type transport system ATP-binding protein